MSKLFQQRRQKHFLELLKYWRLVFNDHFVIALFFLFGALAYGYAQLLPTIPANNWLVKLVLVAWMVVFAQLGRLATLVKRADPVFLLPQTSRMTQYFRRAYGYSWILASLISLVGIVIALPLAMVTYKMTTWSIIAVVMTAVLVKSSWLNLANLQLMVTPAHLPGLQWAKWLLPVVVWLLTWFTSPLVGLIVAILGVVVTWGILSRAPAIFWRRAVQVEEDRMASVYRFFNLFTDVPNLQGRVKRRRYLQPLLSWIGENSAWRLLYGRGFVRNPELSDLVGRLTVVLALILIFVPVTWLNAVIMALALYLIAAQLVSLYDLFANNVFSYVYPLTKQDQLQDFQVLVQKVMLVVGIVLVIASLGTHLSWQQVLINAVIAIVEIPILTRRYLRYRIHKIDR
ncbi:ABC transporter permease [Limosilactobacillus caecicola]|uniref:ABC transporter permease n=1 Tax=Limosilactobacillus caecicola TaxID=2941332 RepID=UPI00203C7720|nr:ABC transporter permease [Limosilactobacillus caecicola]